MNQIHRALCLFALAVLIGAAAPAAPDPGPSETLTRFMRSIESGAFAEAAKLLPASFTATSKKRSKIEASLKEDQEWLQKKGGIAEIEVLSEEIKGGTATVHFRITFGNGDQEKDKEKLRKQEGRWLMEF